MSALAAEATDLFHSDATGNIGPLPTAAKATGTGAAAPPGAAAAAGPGSVGDSAATDVLSLLSAEGRRRTAGSLRNIVAKFHGVEGLVGLHGGLPPEPCFPLASLQFGLDDGTTLQLSAAQLEAAQQYNINPTGYPPLLEWVKQHVRQMHAPPGQHGVLVTDGSSHGLEMVCSLFLDPGDVLLVEEYTFSQMLECVVAPRGCRALPVAMDDQGIIPEELERVLEEARQRGEPAPKLLYTIPTGHNPTGISTTLERKRAVYAICSRHGMLILEDDPYYYLQFPAGPHHPPGLSGLGHGSSYLSLDTQGRVVRLDSFAKFLAPGLRLGWATAAPGVIEKLIEVQAGQTLGPSGLSQVITRELLAAWGEAGLEQHLRRVQALYAEKAAAMHGAAQRELAGLAEWREPQAGMFMWLRLLGLEDASDTLDALKEGRVVVVPGRICHPRGGDPFRCPYIRLSFSHPPGDVLEEGVRRLGAVLRGLQQQQQQPRQQEQQE